MKFKANQEVILASTSPRRQELLERLNVPFQAVKSNVIEKNEAFPENVENMDNVMQGIAYGFHKYAGAKPPKFQKHNYKYTIYSLDNILELSSNIMKKKLLKAMDGHILQKGTIIGYFKR